MSVAITSFTPVEQLLVDAISGAQNDSRLMQSTLSNAVIMIAEALNKKSVPTYDWPEPETKFNVDDLILLDPDLCDSACLVLAAGLKARIDRQRQRRS